MNIKKNIAMLTLYLQLFSPAFANPDNTKIVEVKEKKKLVSLLDVLKEGMDGEYDNSPIFMNQDKFDDMYNASHELHISHEYDYKTTDNKTEKKYITGAGSALGIRFVNDCMYLITNHHVINPDFEEMEVYDKGVKVGDAKLAVTNIMLFQKPEFHERTGIHVKDIGFALECIMYDENLDIAVLRSMAEDHKDMKDLGIYNEFGSSSELKPGDWLYTVGFPGMLSKQICQGIYKGPDHPYHKQDDNIYHMSISGIGGMSGSPVYAIRDGVPEITGIVRQRFFPHDSGAIKIDLIKRYLMNRNVGWLIDGKVPK